MIRPSSPLTMLLSRHTRRREFITLLGGAAAMPSVLWPLAARAQEGERMRRVGVLVAAAADDPEYQARNVAFLQSLQQLGWADGRNARIDTRWATTNSDDVRRHAAELAALAPDVLVAATGTITVAALLQATRTACALAELVAPPTLRHHVETFATIIADSMLADLRPGHHALARQFDGISLR